jgi:hypothetical protein
MKPLLTLERNNADHWFIGVTEFDDRGYGVRSYVLCSQHEGMADIVIRRRYEDMARLMGDDVQAEIRFATFEQAEEEADALNAEGDEVWHTAYVNDVLPGTGYWIVEEA